MWSLRNLLYALCVSLSCVSSAAALIHVSGYEGREVNVSCPYGGGYESYEKYLCKNDCGDNDVLITTTNPKKHKYSIHDDKKKRVFTTTISDLSRRDAGTYWCGVTREGKDIYTQVKLEVGKDTCCDRPTKVQSYEEGSVSFSCPYGSENQNSLKYICRGNQTSTCLQQAVVTSDNQRNGHFTLTDDKEARKVTATITSLTIKDSGSYLCGVHRNNALDVFSAVELEVKEWCCVKQTNKVSGIVGRPVTMQCPHPPQHRDNRKFLCKGDHRSNCTDMVTSRSRFTLQDDVSLSSFFVTVRELKAGDAGTYWCGSDSQWSAANYTKVQLSVDTCCDRPTKVQSYEEGSVSFSCPYGSEYQNSLKYICRGNQTSTCLQQAVVTSDNQRNGHFTLTDDKEARKVTATITKLTIKDSGSYLCGVHRTNALDVFSAVELEVKEWCCVKQTNEVSGIVGHPVTMQCPYPPQHRDNRKFLCKGDHRSNCTDMVTSRSRFTLQDDVSLSSFFVTIRELKAGDAGTYWCGSDSQWSAANYTKVQLSVDTCCDRPTKVQSYEEGSVSFSCPYGSEYQNSLKYICRGNQTSTCLQQAVVTSDNQRNGHFTLTDDKEARKVTATITKLTIKDSGSYLCGVHRNNALDVFSAVELEVKEWCCVKQTNKVSGIVGRPVTMQCPHPPQHRDNRKFLCKGDHRSNCTDMVTSRSRFTLQDDVSLSSFFVTIRELKAGDAGTYWCGSDSQWSAANYTKIQLSVVFPQQTSTVISPITVEPVESQSTHIPGRNIKEAEHFHSVVVIVPAVLLILTFAVVIVYKYKCHKVQQAAVNMDRNKTRATDAEELMDVADINL